jgi:hypothetical protein
MQSPGPKSRRPSTRMTGAYNSPRQLHRRRHTVGHHVHRGEHDLLPYCETRSRWPPALERPQLDAARGFLGCGKDSKFIDLGSRSYLGAQATT